MKKTQRILAIVMCLVLMIGILPISPLAVKKVVFEDSTDLAIFWYDYADYYLAEVRDALGAELRAAGIDFVNFDAQSTQDTQNDQIEYAIAHGAKLLAVNIVNTAEPEAAQEVVDMAAKADIPVIFFNREIEDYVINSYEKACYIGVREQESGGKQGKMAADYILANYDAVDLNNDGIISYIMMKGGIGFSVAELRTQFAVEFCNNALKEAGKPELVYYDANNEDKFQPTDWRTDKAFEQMEKALDEYPMDGDNPIELVFANNDNAAIGCIYALNNEGLNTGSGKSIPVFGIDGMESAMEAMKKGGLTGTVANPTMGYVKMIMSLIGNVADGKDVFAGANENYNVDDASAKIRVPFIMYLKGEIYETDYDYDYDYGIESGNRFSLTEDTWSFSNSPNHFGKSSDGYFITNDDYNRLIGSLSNTDKNAVSLTSYRSNYNIGGILGSIQCVPWGGSCYGMSAWVCLVGAGVLNASDIDSNIDKLNDYILTPEDTESAVESAINYYMWQQRLSASRNDVSEFMSLSQIEQIRILKELATEANAGGSPLLIRYQWCPLNTNGSLNTEYGYGHAVVGYGIQSGNYTEYVQNIMGDRVVTKVFNKRVLIYDCAYPNDERYHLYFSDDGYWCIPGHGIVSTNSQTIDSQYNNGQLKLVTTDVANINLIDYNSGDVSEAVAQTNKFLLTTNSDVSYSLNWGGKSADITGFTVSNSTSDEQINIALDENVTADGGFTPTTATAFLPVTDSYTVETSEDELAFELTSGNYLTSVFAETSGNVTLQTDGSVSMQTDEISDYYIGITANDGYTNLPWYTVEISGEDATEISAELTDDGVVVEGDNLNSITIHGTNDEETVEITVSSDEDSVLISGDDGEIVVLEDKDNNGTYETVIDDAGIGDVNADGVITNADLIMMARYIVGLDDSASVKQYGDINSDSQITNSDLIALARIIVGLE